MKSLQVSCNKCVTILPFGGSCWLLSLLNPAAVPLYFSAILLSVGLPLFSQAPTKEIEMNLLLPKKDRYENKDVVCCLPLCYIPSNGDIVSTLWGSNGEDCVVRRGGMTC